MRDLGSPLRVVTPNLQGANNKIATPLYKICHTFRLSLVTAVI